MIQIKSCDSEDRQRVVFLLCYDYYNFMTRLAVLEKTG